MIRSSGWKPCRSSVLILLVATVLPLVCSFVTYTFVSLPDNSIALDQNGTLVALLVLLKIFLLGSTGRLPVNLNDLFSKFRGKRDTASANEGALVEDLPCMVRILCEVETAAKTGMDDALPDVEALHEGSVDARGQTLDGGDRVEGTLLDVDHIADFHDEAVRALYADRSDDLTAPSRAALAKLAGLTGEGGARLPTPAALGALS
nr:uncharacterized protein LOC113816934 [Penaeus vannamei]